MHNFVDAIFNKNNIHINSKGWQGDNLICFIKKYRQNALNNFKIEKEAYKKLITAKEKDKTIDWFPDVFADNDKDIFIFQYVGEPLNQFNIPSTYKEQVEKIFKDLKNLKIYHNDITMSVFNNAPNFKTEFTVLKDKLYLVDFGQVKFDFFDDYQENISKKTLDFIYKFKTIPFIWCEKKQIKNIIKVFFDTSFLKSGVKVLLKDELGNIIKFNYIWIANVERKISFTTPLGHFANCKNLVNELILNLHDYSSKKLFITIYYNYQNEEVELFEREVIL